MSQRSPTVNPEDESMWAVARQLAQSGDFPNAFSVEAELRKRGFAEVERLAGGGAERDLITETCIAARARLGKDLQANRRRPTMSESEARAALRPLGNRLSQRNQGFVILDLSQRDVITGYKKSDAPEIGLSEVKGSVCRIDPHLPIAPTNGVAHALANVPELQLVHADREQVRR